MCGQIPTLDMKYSHTDHQLVEVDELRWEI